MELQEEIGRIVKAPYTASLKKLHILLQNIEPESKVQAQLTCWAESDPREAFMLAEKVVQAIESSSYALEVLRKLVIVQELGDEVLRLRPGLLDVLLAEAMNHKQEQNVTHSATTEVALNICTTLLSRRLPDNMPLPSAAEPFFQMMFTSAVTEPYAVKKIQVVNGLISGACGDLTSILSMKYLEDFRTCLTRVMRSVKSVHEQLLSLECLAILSKIATEDTFEEQTTARRFFRGERAMTTLTLLGLQIVFCCQDESKIEGGRARRVRLAREIATHIDRDVRERWIAEGGRAAARKLHEKVTQGWLDGQVMLDALAFISLLGNLDTVPENVVQVFEKTIILAICDNHLGIESRAALALALPFVVPRTAQGFWHDLLVILLESVLKICTVSHQAGNDLKQTILVLQELTKTSNFARNCFVSALASPKINTLIVRLLEPEPTQARSISQDVKFSFLQLVLSCGFSAQVDSLRLDPDLARRLLDKQREYYYSTTNLAQPFPRFPHQSSISLFQEANSQQEQGISQQWREKLVYHLNAETRSREETVIRLVGQICHDLEERCENIETPLRIEQEKCKNLERDNETHQACINDLNSQVANLSSKLFTAEQALAKVEEDYHDVSDRIASQLEKTDSLEEELKGVQHESDLRQAEKTQAEKKELELRITNTSNVARLEECANEINALENQLKDLRRESNEQKKAQECLILDGKELQLQLEKKEATILAQRTTLEQFKSEVCGQQATIDSLTRDNEDFRSAHCKLEDRYKSLVTTSLKEKQMAQDDAERKLEAIEKSMLTAQEMSSAQLRNLEQRLEDLQQQSASDVSKRDSVIQDLRKSLQRYAKDNERKTIELKEAQQMRANLLSAMGVDSTNQLIGGILDYDKTAGERSAPGQSKKALSLSHAEDSMSLLELPDRTLQSSQGSSDSPDPGPTPKRAKPRANFKIPETQESNFSTLVASSSPVKGRPPPVGASRSATSRRRTTNIMPRSESAANLSQQTKPALHRRTYSERGHQNASLTGPGGFRVIKDVQSVTHDKENASLASTLSASFAESPVDGKRIHLHDLDETTAEL